MIPYNMLKNVYNVFHYYINKRKGIYKVKHVQGIMLAHVNLK